MRLPLAALTALAIALCATTPARAGGGGGEAARPPLGAQKKQPVKANAKYAQAKKLFDQGSAAYVEGDYEAAIDAWQRSYELSGEPLIFESIANAYERLGDARKARENLARWRAAAPPEEHTALDAHLRNLDARIARDEERAARKAQAEEAERRAQQAKAEAAAKPRWPGFALLGVGSAAVIAGVTLDILARAGRPSPGDCLRTDTGKSLCLDTARDAITRSNTFATAGDILWISGAVLAAGGLALVITHGGALPGGPAPTTTLAPAATLKGAGLLLEHRF